MLYVSPYPCINRSYLHQDKICDSPFLICSTLHLYSTPISAAACLPPLTPTYPYLPPHPPSVSQHRAVLSSGDSLQHGRRGVQISAQLRSQDVPLSVSGYTQNCVCGRESSFEGDLGGCLRGNASHAVY